MTKEARGPAAVRTFLIADVRGYTRFTQEQGDEAAAALAASFAAIVRSSVAELGGTLVELRGDEALVVFSSARDAVRAAVDLQRRARTGTEDVRPLPLGLGIGLDAGEAVPTEGGYRGGALNLAARLCSIAEPGQVYASQGVVHLARHVPGVRYAQPRAVRLKGIAERVQAVPVVPEVPLPPLSATKVPARRRRVAGAVVVAAGVAVAAATVAYVLMRGDDVSTGIAANATALLDASGKRIAEVPVTGRPSAVAAGAGAVWVADAVDGSVLRIDPEEQHVADRIGVGRDPEAVVVGDGLVWVANSQDGTVSQINPDKGNVVDTVRVGNGPTGLAFTPGAVWVVNELDATLSRVSSRTGQVVGTVPLGENPTAIAAGLGAVWVTSEEAGLLLRIDPASNSVSQTISVGNGPSGVAVGSGAVWVASAPDHAISRVDPASGAVTKIALDGAPRQLAFTDDGLWSANTLEGRLVLVDPGEGAVRRTIDVRTAPDALAGDGNRLWVTALASRSTHRGGTLRILSEGDDSFDSIDPAVGFRAASWQALSIVYDGLMTFRRVPGPLSATVVPDLAASPPTVQAGGKTYVFRLRRGIRYSDGRLVKARDFRYAIERQLRNETGLAFVGVDVIGADRCSKRRCDLSRGIVANDEAGTVTFRLTHPDPDFLFKLALPFGAAVPVGSRQPDVGTRPLPATGPYMIERYVRDRTLVLVRNPRFREWSAEAQPAGFPGRLEWRFGVDAGRAAAMVEQGDADVMVDPPPEERLLEIARRFASQAHPYVRSATFFLFLNTRVPPFDDVRVRQALNLATDRAELVREWGGAELARPTCQLLPPGFPSYRPYCPHTKGAATSEIWTAPDVARARRLLERANAAAAKVTVAVNRDDRVKLATARYFVRLLDELGFRATLRLYPDIQAFYEHAGKPASKIHAGIQGWESNLPRPSDFFLNLLTCSAYRPADQVNLNAAGFCDRDVDRISDRAHELEASDPAAAGELWQRVERRVIDLAPIVPFVNATGVDLVSARIGNYQRTVRFGVLLDQLWVE